MMTDDEAADLLQRVTAGASIRSMTQGAAAPFSEWHYKAYCQIKPAFHAALKAASKVNERVNKRRSTSARYADKTHCNAGHPYTHPNLYLKPTRGGGFTRQCKACSKAFASRYRPMFTEIVERRWKPPAAGSVDNAAHFLSFGANDHARIKALVPQHLPDNARDEVVQDVVLSLLEGRISHAEIERYMKQYVRRYHREYPTFHPKLGRAELFSLDEVLDKGGTMHNTISEGLWQ